MSEALNIQRRKWKRFKIKGGAIVLLHKQRVIDIGSPKLIELGPIIDISLGGLAVQYVENKKRAITATELSISVPSEGIALSGLEFLMISDKAIAQLPDGKLIRNRCVEFANLAPQKRFQLESFINHYSMNLKRDRRAGIDRRQYNDPKFADEDYYRMYNRRTSIDRRKILVFTK
ncbi:MAG: hypothetical protein ABIL58_06390 [Pseudomonadota bacterium]